MSRRVTTRGEEGRNGGGVGVEGGEMERGVSFFVLWRRGRGVGRGRGGVRGGKEEGGGERGRTARFGSAPDLRRKSTTSSRSFSVASINKVDPF